MELQQYLKILQKEKFSIILIVAFALLIGYFYSLKSSPGYRLEQTFLIEATSSALPANSNSPSQPQIQLTSLQDEARNFTETAVALIKSGELQAIQPRTSVSAEKVAPQLLKVTVFSPSAESSQKQLESTIEGFNQNIAKLISHDSISIKPIGPTPQAQPNNIRPEIILVLSFFAGLTAALMTVGLKTYFKI